MAADSMKLIAYGKVLEDDNKSLKDYGIKEGDFLVVMVSKVGKISQFINFFSPSLNLPHQLSQNQRMLRRKKLDLNQPNSHLLRLKLNPNLQLSQSLLLKLNPLRPPRHCPLSSRSL